MEQFASTFTQAWSQSYDLLLLWEYIEVVVFQWPTWLGITYPDGFVVLSFMCLSAQCTAPAWGGVFMLPAHQRLYTLEQFHLECLY